jgi:hypothetical protein
MKGWVLDSTAAIVSLIIFLVCLIAISASQISGDMLGYAYIVAIGIFILVMSGAGVWLGNKTI